MVAGIVLSAIFIAFYICSENRKTKNSAHKINSVKTNMTAATDIFNLNTSGLDKQEQQNTDQSHDDEK